MRGVHKTVLVFGLALVLILVPFASANIFSDIFGKLTGMASDVSVDQVCSDYDGKNTYVKGTTYIVGQEADSKNDYCVGGTVNEFYCENGEIKSEEIPCSAGCLKGECHFSKDLYGECFDSDGKNLNVGGKTFIIGQESDSKNDYCKGGTVREFYCEDGEIKSEFFRCSAGCLNGACSSMSNFSGSCFDSDGKDHFNRGFIAKGEYNWTDYCFLGDLYEYYCSDDLIAVEIVKCETECYWGTCLSEESILEEENETEIEEEVIVEEGLEVVVENETEIEEEVEVLVGEELITEEEVEVIEEESEAVEESEETSDKKNKVEESSADSKSIAEQKCSGCFADEKCFMIGYRDNEMYCAKSLEFKSQSEESSICNNSFECESNLCISNECISQSFWEKVMNFFKKIF